MDKTSYLTTLLVSFFILLTFILEIKSTLNDAIIGGFLFVSVVLAGILGSYVFKKYKNIKISFPTVLVTYFAVAIVLVVVINNIQ